MPFYHITQSVRHAVTYLVEAANVDEAEELLLSGEANETIVEDDIVGTDITSVEEVKP
jgi:hypothetical protein